jgi:hypothetical protein
MEMLQLQLVLYPLVGFHDFNSGSASTRSGVNLDLFILESEKAQIGGIQC